MLLILNTLAVPFDYKEYSSISRGIVCTHQNSILFDRSQGRNSTNSNLYSTLPDLVLCTEFQNANPGSSISTVSTVSSSNKTKSRRKKKPTEKNKQFSILKTLWSNLITENSLELSIAKLLRNLRNYLFSAKFLVPVTSLETNVPIEEQQCLCRRRKNRWRKCGFQLKKIADEFHISQAKIKSQDVSFRMKMCFREVAPVVASAGILGTIFLKILYK